MSKQYSVDRVGDQYAVQLWVRQTMGNRWAVAHRFGVFADYDEALEALDELCGEQA